MAAPEDGRALRDQAARGLRRAVEFFRNEVAVHGTYLWRYSEDLARREGEGVASATRGWVQPPGTPSVGGVFLTAHTATGEGYYLEAARETAHGLRRGQLASGGWTYVLEFDPVERRKFAFRDGGKPTARNVTTLDDDTTQAALRFLMHTDHALGFKDAQIHECVQYALESLLKAQYPNGGWPQGYDRFPDPELHPVKKAAYPETWSRTWPGSEQYWQRYTLNDNALATTIETMFEAGRIYGSPAPGNDFTNLAARCRAAAQKAGDFLLLAQMPDPQPAWAQQYDFNMQPAWARKFEPPAVTGGESHGVMKMLLQVSRETGQRKYLEPIPRALDYLRRSRLPDGRLARFYELRTNKPLYFTKDYQLTYDDRDMPTHYAFKVSDGTDAIARDYERLKALAPDQLVPVVQKKPASSGAAMAAQVKTVLSAQDARGRWVEGGGLRYHRPLDPTVRVIRCDTFIRNVEILSRYLEATRE
jgi:PelA/Pel-15E family pectate lyase